MLSILRGIVLLSVFFTISDEDRLDVNIYIERISKGDTLALSELYRLIGGRLLAIAQGIMRNKYNAEDVLHDSLIKLVRYAKNFKIGTNGYAWICKIVKNTALNKLKSEHLRRAEDIDDIFGLSDGRDYFEVSTSTLDVKNALLKLESKERLIIWLKYYNDMTVREIAAETGMKKTTVQDYIKRAEQKLSKLLK